MVNENDLKDRLLELEPVNPDRQQRFRDELTQIVNPPLPRLHRLYYMGAIVCLLLGLPGALCGLTLDAEHRGIWAFSVGSSLAFVGWLYLILKRGSEPFSMMQGASKGLSGLSFIIAAALIVMSIQSPSLASILWSMLAMLFFALMTSINLWNQMIASERTVREHILRLEYQLAGGKDFA